MRNVCTQPIVRRTLQAVERDVPGYDIPFQCPLSHFLRQSPCHDHLVLHLAEGQLFRRRIAAVEAHECILLCIVIFALNVFFIHILRHRIVDIKERYHIVAYHCSDKLAKRTVNVHFTGYRNSLCSQPAIDIARHESKLCLECRPAFPCKCNVFAVSFVCLNPILQCQFVLGKFLKNLWLLVACAKLCFHLLHNCRNPLVPGVFVKCLEQVKL